MKDPSHPTLKQPNKEYIPKLKLCLVSIWYMGIILTSMSDVAWVPFVSVMVGGARIGRLLHRLAYIM